MSQSHAAAARLSTGIPALDEHLGGGLLPGALTVVLGATGIGKTQLGIQFAAAQGAGEGRRGVILDLSSRGDSQSHAPYAARLANWTLTSADGHPFDPTQFFQQADYGDTLHAFQYSGRRVTRSELDWDEWRQWQAELNQRLQATIAMLYGSFVRGCRRVVIDGVEPTEQPADSIQMYLFEYVYHQILRKDPEWVARDLFREHYRTQAAEVARHSYSPQHIGCLLLVTSHEAMLDELITRPLADGDALANANTLIYMGKLREGRQLRRGLVIAKHRGSACTDDVLFYRIGAEGLVLEA